MKSNLKKPIIASIGIIVVIIISGSFVFFSFVSPNPSNSVTIYRYTGFMGYGDPNSSDYNSTAIDNTVFYNWAKENGYNMSIVETDDANQLLSLLKHDQSSPRADVVIGLDNALLALMKEQNIANDLLEPYISNNLSLLNPNLVEQLDPNHLLTPVDYGALAFYYDRNKINSSIIPNIDSLTIEEMEQPSIADQLILENPESSSPGTGFLLWTIAAYKLENKLNNWTNFWSAVKNHALIVNSWTDGFDEFSSPTSNKDILLSYATSPAYDWCNYNYNDTEAFFTHENKTTNSWLQIEGIGLVKHGPNPEAGKKFIDWMLSNKVQNLIAVTNWMYPANSYSIEHLPQCFSEKAISPDKINPLNNVLHISEVEQNIANWFTQWEQTVLQNIVFNQVHKDKKLITQVIHKSLALNIIEKREKH